MIKKISLIKNMAVFQDFDWNTSVRDKGNNIACFCETNIIYGRNYSGKTTLSRILRSLENKSLPPKYSCPEFNIEDSEGNNFTQTNLPSFTGVVRVFNEDFVKENLQFISNPDSDIKSFAIIGSDNLEIEKGIAKLEETLGDKEKNTGLYKELSDAVKNQEEARGAHSKAESDLLQRRRDKARKIKNNTTLYSDTGYDIRKIDKDIQSVSKDSYEPLSDEEEELFKQALKETAKIDIHRYQKPDFKIDSIFRTAKELLTR